MTKWSKVEFSLRNVKSFLSAKKRQIYDKFVGLEPHIKEQILYRHSLCKNDCFVPDEDGHTGCIYCGCDPYGKAFSKKSCNKGERFPDLMDKETWNKYKETIKKENKLQ